MTLRVDNGPCRHCGRPVLYQGADFCSPRCNELAFGIDQSKGAPVSATQQVNPLSVAATSSGLSPDISPGLPSVDRFRGEFRFLSNFYPAPTALDGVIYPTSEHAYQAAKTLEPRVREHIRGLVDPAEAKRAGRVVPLRPNWDAIKTNVMYGICLDKFERNLDLRQQLLATGSAQLIEGNTWGDTFWGVCRGRGENQLGKVLMQVRQELLFQNSEPKEQRSALLSDDGVFRYLLARVWGPEPRALFIGLNPSTADANEDDPTVNWWRAFSKKLGCGGFVAANLSAFRTSQPKNLAAAGYPVGTNNDEAILEAVKLCSLVVGCWGSSGGQWALERGIQVKQLIAPVEIYCFGKNVDGGPRHPLSRGKNRVSVEEAQLRLWA